MKFSIKLRMKYNSLEEQKYQRKISRSLISFLFPIVDYIDDTKIALSD